MEQRKPQIHRFFMYHKMAIDFHRLRGFRPENELIQSNGLCSHLPFFNSINLLPPRSAVAPHGAKEAADSQIFYVSQDGYRFSQIARLSPRERRHSIKEINPLFLFVPLFL
jgi:hypothetical protein